MPTGSPTWTSAATAAGAALGHAGDLLPHPVADLSCGLFLPEVATHVHAGHPEASLEALLLPREILLSWFWPIELPGNRPILCPCRRHPARRASGHCPSPSLCPADLPRFSAYGHRRGLGLLFGYRWPENFNLPYLATSIQDFWRFRHITLSRFLRDYLYVALGGNRRGPVRTYANLMITMLLGGLWHGASWTFLLWGGLHGFFLVVNRLWSDSKVGRGLNQIVARHIWSAAAWSTICWFLTFHCVCLAWCFFRLIDLKASLACVRTTSHFDHHLMWSVALIHHRLHWSCTVYLPLWLSGRRRKCCPQAGAFNLRRQCMGSSGASV